MKSLVVCLALVAGLLAGCTAPDNEADGTTLYSHDWTYGPGYGGGEGFPVFRDTFVADASEVLTVALDWNIKKGQAAVVLTPSEGEEVNLTDQETGGPDARAEVRIEGAAGEWQFRIPTWRDVESGFPTGSVSVRVLGA